jgi:hypothetical protein
MHRLPRARIDWRAAARTILTWLALFTVLPGSAFAQRELRWSSLDVAAHLDASGTLHVVEAQTLVFTGDWNGGERTFHVRPRQQLTFQGISRVGEGGLQGLSEDSFLDDVDEYGWSDGQTLRWRSRLASDPPFNATPIRYELRYSLSGIVLKDGDEYRIDHDFAFPDRPGPIEQFELHLTLDPAWQPLSEVRPLYSAGPLPPGSSFVLDVPLRYAGPGAPAVLDLTRPPQVVRGVQIILVATLLTVLWFFVREQRLGRFAPLARPVDEPWLREHVLKYPAEAVAAAWDETVGPAEVVSLIARMVHDGKLGSTVGKGKGKDASMTLRLQVDRSALEGHERTLVDKLFFNGRTETSTNLVRKHYRTKGFNPSQEIERELKAAVDGMLPAGRSPRRFGAVRAIVLAFGLGVILMKWSQGYPGAFAVTAAMLLVTGLGWFAGHRFRAYLEWGPRQAVLCLIPTLALAVGVALYLWFRAVADELQPMTVVGLVAVALACISSSVDALKSRRHREALAFRKTLTARRAFFLEELRKERPALRDEWYPWLLAFELGKQVDEWSTHGAPGEAKSRGGVIGSSSSPSAPATQWTGFSGGRSGGAGGGASWQAAASGMAASVSPPSSSGSGGSSGSSGSSSGGSSGGGGGGGW